MYKHLFGSVIIGAPGSGKGTISSRIVKCFDIHHLSSGDLLRKNMLNNTALGKDIKKYVNSGTLVPDDVMVSLIGEEIMAIGNRNFLLDGFPRTLMQAKLLYEKQPIHAALNLIVPFEVIIERVKDRWIHEPSGRIYNLGYSPPKVEGKDDMTGEDLIQRPDDMPATVQKRLESYSANIDPVLDFYRDLDILQDFAGKTSNEIWPKVYKFLTSKMTPIGEYKIK